MQTNNGREENEFLNDAKSKQAVSGRRRVKKRSLPSHHPTGTKDVRADLWKEDKTIECMNFDQINHGIIQGVRQEGQFVPCAKKQRWYL